MNIVYLHGFNSSPESLKARETATYLQEHAIAAQWHCPRLPVHPAQAIVTVDKLLSQLSADTLLIGSSLGGYYASYLAEQYHFPTVLINPAIQPYLHLARLLGEQRNPYTGEVYTLSQADIQDLLTIQVEQPNNLHTWLLLGTNDEVLDWRQASRHYRKSRQTILNGDDHRLQRWSTVLPDILAWASNLFKH
ncbi:hypothetical protein HZU77_003550 [Neisseriaceae bacterium TC5R-5]|nr:hypothetical protein [Neisseriaceae bacterium TC5R-5]